MNPHHTAKSSIFGHLMMLPGPGAAGEPRSGDAKTSYMSLYLKKSASFAGFGEDRAVKMMYLNRESAGC